MHFTSKQDQALYDSLAHLSFLEKESDLHLDPTLPAYMVTQPDEKYSFLHEAALISFKGKIFAAWYNCPKWELKGDTPIRFATSSDLGKTWSAPKVVANDPTGTILYCPPVFGLCEGKLYLLLNEMVAPDHIHSLDLYLYDENTQVFTLLWKKALPFKLNTNVCTLKNGTLLLPGRTGPLDGFPDIPAVLVSQSGKINADWELIRLQEDHCLPDGSHYIHPEMTLIEEGDTLYMFVRNDQRKVPLVYLSKDNGRSWSKPYAHDIPFSDSKIYAGTLKDGRHYLIGNTAPGRTKLALYLTEGSDLRFTKAFYLQDGFSQKLGLGYAWHYPCACEEQGKLLIGYTVSYEETMVRRGMALTVVDTASIMDTP